MSVATRSVADTQAPSYGSTPVAASTSCQRVVVTQHGGPEVLRVVTEALPVPRAGEVRMRTLAAGVSA
jgi:hypothetical protein